MNRAGDEPDIEIGAFAKAKKLRFKKTPETEVRFHGEPDVDSLEESGRENLPEKVEPGVTYRDVKVGWRASARIRRRDTEGPSD